MKKAKFVTNLLIFCIALIALCFGIYAAISLSFKVDGTINYTINDACVEVTTQMYHSPYKASSNYKLKTDMVDILKSQSVDYISANASAFGLTVIDINGQAEGTANFYDSTASSVQNNNHNSVEGLSVRFKDKDALSYYIVISIKNIEKSANAYARIIDQQLAKNMNSFVYVSEGYAKIAPQETKTIIIAFSLDDKTIEVKGAEFEYEIEIGAGEMSTDIQLVDINKDNTPDFWGIKMGYIRGNGNSKTDVYWRLISTDNGVSAYNFNKNVTPVGMCVFVLETPIVKKIAFNSVGTDYASSMVRSYINNQFLSDLNIEPENIILANIKSKNLLDLYKNNVVQQTSTSIEYKNGVMPNIQGIDIDTKDKFYLLSMQETLNLMANFYSTSLTQFNNNLYSIKNNIKWSASSWWTRSAAADFNSIKNVSIDGTIVSADVTSQSAVRPAFNLYI